MKKLLLILLISASTLAKAQAPQQWSSSEIGLALKKLKVLGTVLYIAAHPDDENTQLLAYFSKGKNYRTGYLSLTRGDGGQNLIGDEQGIELGLLRTQELLSARRIDGAQQFFSRAYDFGFSKSTDEALTIWGKDKILSDVVWVIRNFRPDIIITRFPPDERAGHGQHSASSVLAREAFDAAGDKTKFPEQFQYGVEPWQPKHIFWNTYNFGAFNTTANDQLKIDVGVYQNMLGKSFGEISSQSRSQHKSQGFGDESSRGEEFEFLKNLAGDVQLKDPFTDIPTDWSRVEGGKVIETKIDSIIENYSLDRPDLSVLPLAELYKSISALPESYWRKVKLAEVQKLIAMASGLYMEAVVSSPLAVIGDSLGVKINLINRSSAKMQLKFLQLESFQKATDTTLAPNRNYTTSEKIAVALNKPISQPYWLVNEMEKGSYTVKDQQLIGLPESPASYNVTAELIIEGTRHIFSIPVQYKHTDPVRGELFEPLTVTNPVSLNTSPPVMLFHKGQITTRSLNLSITSYTDLTSTDNGWMYRYGTTDQRLPDSLVRLRKNSTRTKQVSVSNKFMNGNEKDRLMASFLYKFNGAEKGGYLAMATINYNHIPPIRYFYQDGVTILNLPVKIAGKRVGYIKGAGDRVPEALGELGFTVSYLTEQDMDPVVLKKYDAIVTGIRAYNVHDWLSAHYDDLMQYVKEGGNLVVQYNTNSFAGPFQAKMSPFPFEVSRNRVTDENAVVNFEIPNDELLNRPNKITASDFEGWIQERGIYFAEKTETNFRTVLSMKDPVDKALQKGSLIAAKYGKGRFIYTGLAFFRQLPAGVPGAYRLFANLVSNPNSSIDGTK
ncbi:PIG-L family deacetylase [Pollutibacter soli]|uniref:PIG-L family deacetylase n=1 Tax=Pollutibacter soli TaxID=3034157 RepID=UPI00301336E4